MKVPAHRFALLLLASLLAISIRPALADSMTYNGNGSTQFGGIVGNGSLTVSDDGSGGLDFSFTLSSGSSFATFIGNGGGGNDIVIYLDNGQGGGIGLDTSLLTDDGDGGRSAISEFSGGGRSTLNFNGFMDPQYAIDLQSDFGDIFQLADLTGTFNFVDGNSPGSGPSGKGASYTISGSTATLDLPATDFGLSAFSGDTINFLAILTSETGFSSNEATVGLTGNSGWGNTQTVTGVNSFTLTSVPEGSSAGLLACGAAVLLVFRKRFAMRRRV